MYDLLYDTNIPRMIEYSVSKMAALVNNRFHELVKEPMHLGIDAMIFVENEGCVICHKVQVILVDIST